jgi:hypothetical protein
MPRLDRMVDDAGAALDRNAVQALRLKVDGAFPLALRPLRACGAALQRQIVRGRHGRAD